MYQSKVSEILTKYLELTENKYSQIHKSQNYKYYLSAS